jgi:omega-6 fatty acid desaturase (delta-12 desaturase)
MCVPTTNALMAVDKSTSSDFQQQHWSSSYDPRKPNAPTLPTKGQIRAIVPNECFTRSYTLALSYLTRDTAMSIGCVYIAYNALSTELPSSSSSLSSVLVWLIGWTTYAFCMGCTITGHWVIAHECGHGAFTPNQSLNDICGFLMHQALLVPYFSWQYTHAKHHRRTNNTMDGESHVPGTRTEVGLDEYGLTRVSNWAVIHEAIGDGPFGALKILANLILGWPRHERMEGIKKDIRYKAVEFDGWKQRYD